ncbi:hypothetical protein GJAV_G00182090 [Gymnothorax javanicus]|nr:hypothetical protein GJAV_G00182090 [Gymnothorax javanicus]
MGSTTRDTALQPQVLSLGRQDASRLLQTYVKRSLSFDGRGGSRKAQKKYRKWVPISEKTSGVRRHSSDSSVHLAAGVEEVAIECFKPALPESLLERPVVPELESSAEHKQDDKLAKKGTKKTKKPSWIRSFLNLFSRKEEKKSRSPERGGSFSPTDTLSPPESCLPVHGPPSGPDPLTSPQTHSSRHSKRSRRRFSLRNRDTDQPRRSLKKPDTLALSEPGTISDVVCVAPTSLYYEKVSEELEKILKEVKDSPTDEHHSIIDQNPESLRIKSAKEAEILEKILALLKEQANDINEELKANNGWLGSFFGTLNYSSFQQLADLYLESETPRQTAEGVPTAPELVKFALTLDFTAKVAGLSSQTLGRIMGFGNQYLQDRFTQMSAAQGTESQSRPEQTFSGPD